MYEYSSVSASSYDPGALVAKLNEAAADGWDVVSIVPTGGDVSAFLRRDAAGAAEEALVEEAIVEEAIIEEAAAEELAFEEAAAEAAAEDEWSAGDTAAAAALADAAADGSADQAADTTSVEAVEVVEVETIGAVEEPAGWAVAPETPADTADADTATGSTDADTGVAAGAADAATGTTEAPAAEDIPVVATGSAVVEEVEPAAVAQPSPAPAPTPAPEPAPVVTTPAGWYPDPSTRYELRYWDGTQWTEHVARQGQQFTDPPVR